MGLAVLIEAIDVVLCAPIDYEHRFAEHEHEHESGDHVTIADVNTERRDPSWSMS